MKYSGIAGFFGNLSPALGGLQRLDRWGMSSSERVSRPHIRDGMGSRNGLLALFFLLGAVCSGWTFWLLEDFGYAGKKARAEGFCEENVEVPPVQYNLSNKQLQALALLLSSVDRGIFYECLKKSLVDVDLNNNLIDAFEVLHNESDQFPIKDNTVLQGQSPIQDNCVSVDPTDLTPKVTMPSANYVKDYDVKPYKKEEFGPRAHDERTTISFLGMPLLLVMSIVLFSLGSCFGRSWKFSRQQLQRQEHCQPHVSSCSRKWMKRILVLGVLAGLLLSLWIFISMKVDMMERRKETLANMCDERARMLQDQFNVSMNHVHALAILVSTFHHGKKPSAIDQKTFEEYTARTEFERPLMSGVAYALKVLHSEREDFEMQHGWKIKKMETEDHSPVQDDYFPEKLEPSPVQEEYAPVIFTQETVSHIVSIDMMSGKQDRENILRARATGKGVLTFPFDLLKSNRLGVVLTFAVYNSDLPSNATPEERIEATVGYLGASFDVASLVEKLLQQLSSKQTIVVNLYDTTYASAPMMMYSPDAIGAGEVHVSKVDLGDPTHKHEMHCRFKHKHPLPWSAISTSLSGVIIVLLIGYIIHAALNRIEEVEDDYLQMKELKIQAEAADVAKSQFLATVSHEIRTPMNGVLGMLQMLMDTELDATQQDFAMTAQSSGKALIALINEVLDLAKIESGRLELEAVPFDVRDVLDNVLSLFSDKSQAKRIELAVYVSDGVPEVLIGDPGRFRQVITNLVGNSVKFTEEGHIFVSVHLVDEINISCDFNNHISEGDIEVFNEDKKTSYNTLSGYFAVNKRKNLENFSILRSFGETSGTINLVVKVEDTGVGIPEEAQRRIFTPFMQADSSTSRTYGGTGIGLNISKCLVNLMGGEISFESKPGVGSTFTFTAVFNGGKSSSDMKKHTSGSVSLDFKGMRGLVVDGRIIRADVAKYHLQRLGVQVKIATTQKSAISTIIDNCNSSGKEHLDMVFVDKDAWGKGSGLAFPHPLVELKQNGVLRLKNMPKFFLLATSLSLVEVEDLKSAGYADTIMKPLRLSMIAACLRKTLGVENQSHLGKGQPVALRSLLRGKNILVVDDNAVNRIVATGVLKKFGAIVTCTESGKAAIGLLQPPHGFDACFMDVQMPEMDGFEATRQIRSMESKVNELIKSGGATLETYGNVAYWHVPILAMTADVIQATYEQCIRCGMDDYVSKPFEEQQLYSAVAHFFESDMAEADSL